jgi:hypothetical protein
MKRSDTERYQKVISIVENINNIERLQNRLNLITAA